ncbi:hypothetical protein [Lentimicrobium sp. S6]|uniref:hypothetical protein n=1 Tax=Lentimicrobium sp. S6 TaxID=2735872 RepID=UPI0015561730|nr:hypothetical protein [Lentimicrobium sp. S6]NPD47899.1 hypothetical protein [Lentimicrobium sp. S6]
MKKILFIGVFLLSTISFSIAQITEPADANGANNTIGSSSTGTAIGQYTTSQSTYSMAAGYYSEATGMGSFALGNHVNASAYNAWIIGSGFLKEVKWVDFTNTTSNSLMMGFNMLEKPSFFVEPFSVSGLDDGYVGIHTTTPRSTLDVAGTLTVDGFVLSGMANDGYVLTYENGKGVWKAATGGGGGSYTHPDHSGQVESDGDGATYLTVEAIKGHDYGIEFNPTDEIIYSNGVELKRIDINWLIKGQKYLMESTISPTDQFLFSDDGTLKKMDVALLETYMQNNLDFGSGGGIGTPGVWEVVNGTKDIYYGEPTVGYVGIGTAPEESLHTKGKILSEGGIRLRGEINTIEFGGSATSKFQIKNGELSTLNSAFTIDENDNIGIGQDTPGAKLDVDGTTKISQTLIVGGTITAEDGIKMLGSTNKIVFGEEASSIFQIARNSTSKGIEPPPMGTQTPIFTIDANNRVGIGTDSPDTELDVEGTVSSTVGMESNKYSLRPGHGNGLNFWNTTAYSIYMSRTLDGTYGGRLDATSDYNMYFKMTSGINRGFVFKSGNTPVAQIDGSGNLILEGTTKTTGFQMTNGSALDGKILQSDASGNASWVDPGTLSGVGIWSGDESEAYYYGSVGIGTDSPEASLHIKPSANAPGFQFESFESDMTYPVDYKINAIGGESTSTLQFYNSNHGTDYSWSCGSESLGTIEGMHLTIRPWKDETTGYFNSTELHLNGRMGINTPVQPGHALSVNGTLGCKKVVVTLLDGDWPDYVFADEYQLPILSEVEDYVKENKHLPGVPSAAQIEEDGLDLGAMNVILLQKIEELTLLMIQQQKEIDALKEKSNQ